MFWEAQADHVSVAVIHYSPPAEGSAIIDRDKIYLCDSGAQYLDGKSSSCMCDRLRESDRAGTTDTTRTWVRSLVSLLTVVADKV